MVADMSILLFKKKIKITTPNHKKKNTSPNSIFWDLDMLDLSLDTLDFSTQDWLLPAFDAGGASRQTLLAGRDFGEKHQRVYLGIFDRHI